MYSIQVHVLTPSPGLLYNIHPNNILLNVLLYVGTICTILYLHKHVARQRHIAQVIEDHETRQLERGTIAHEFGAQPYEGKIAGRQHPYVDWTVPQQ